MIKLKDLLKELDFGKFPFTDPDAVQLGMLEKMSLERLIDKYKYVTEPNTKDEQKLLKDLSKYFENEGNTVQVSGLKALLAVKSKFPGILDPEQADDFSYVYRGTSMSISEVLKYDWNKLKDQYGQSEFECKSNNVMMTAKGDRGFSSFSVYEDTAADFANEQYIDFPAHYIKNNLVPVVTSIYISDPNALFNPAFSKIFNIHGNEGEVLLIGTKYKSPKTKLVFLDDVFENIQDQGKLSSEWKALAKHLKIEL
jgi:hypothetical protein